MEHTEGKPTNGLVGSLCFRYTGLFALREVNGGFNRHLCGSIEAIIL